MSQRLGAFRYPCGYVACIVYGTDSVSIGRLDQACVRIVGTGLNVPVTDVMPESCIFCFPFNFDQHQLL
jgi:hypothetical protein